MPTLSNAHAANRVVVSDLTLGVTLTLKMLFFVEFEARSIRVSNVSQPTRDSEHAKC
jgi:hypothetical protein